jgi:glycosyltransferase involved in cell wall biosynthesis
MKPLISIITPTYNHEKYISECIESVINQSYKNWEMIIIDDVSSDKTYEIASNFAKQDKRIKIIHHKTNWGIKRLKDTYNQALKQAKGELIAILEGDDFWPKNKLKTQIKAFKDKSVVLSYGKWAMTNQSGKTIYVRDYKNFDKNLLKNQPKFSILKLFLTLKFDIGSQTVMIRKNVLDKISGFKNDKFYPFVDIPTYLYLAAKGKFAYIPEVLGYYRRTEKSSWFMFASKSSTMGRKEVKDCINNFVKTKTKKFSETLDWQKIEKEQNQYLLKRKILHFPSVVYNKFLAKQF